MRGYSLFIINTMKRTLLFNGIFFSTVLAFSQTPVIQNIEPSKGNPLDTIVITGSGFSSTQANLDVWFGPVRATIVASTEFSIEAVVPPQVSVSNIEVLNRTSRLSATSREKFYPNFQGANFSVNNFSAPVSVSATEELWDIATSDLDRDGKPDIIATKFETPSAQFAISRDLMIMRNTSTPGSAPSFVKIDRTNLPALVSGINFPTDNVVAGDLQGDGLPDLVFSRTGQTKNTIHILRNTSTVGNINFATPNITLALDAQDIATRMRIRDLNRDGRPDIIVSNTFSEFIYIFLNQSTSATAIAFNPTPIKISVKPTGSTEFINTYEVDVQDLDGDNLPELIVNEFQQDDIYILRNTTTSTLSFASPSLVAVPDLLNRLTTADVNNDGKYDIIATSTFQNKAVVYLNTTSGSTISFNTTGIQLLPATGSGTQGMWGVDVHDIDGDGDQDILTANRNQNAIHIFVNNGNATPSFTRSDLATTNFTRNIKVSDLDGDAKPDITYVTFNSTTPPNSSRIEVRRNTNCHRPDIINDDVESVFICNGQTLILETTPAVGVTYSWTRNGVAVAGQTTNKLSITSDGNYVVTATSEGGACQIASPTVTVTANTGLAPPFPTITAPAAVCTGANLQLSTPAVTNAQYIWTAPDGSTLPNSNNPQLTSVTINQAGEYKLVVKVGVCKSYESSKRIDVADLADFAILSDDATNLICQGQDVVLSVSSLTGYSYQWRRDGTNITSGGTASSLTVTTQGNYTVQVTNNALSCNKTTAPVLVTVYTLPVANYTASATICTGQEITFTNTSTGDSRATMTYAWTLGDATTSTDASPKKTYTTGGNLNPQLTVSYQGVTGCSNLVTKPLTVFQTAIPVINSAAPSLCATEQTTLSLTGGTFTTTTWNSGATTPTLTVTGPGTYSVNTIDNNGCTSTDDIIVAAKVTPQFTVEATPATIAAGESSQLSVIPSITPANFTYLWTPAASLDNATSGTPLASPIETTTYSVTVTSADNCAVQGEVLLTVQGASSFPVAFSPNGDGINDFWNIRAQDKPNCTLSIFDGKGRRVFENKGQNWDGTYQGAAVPLGTYYYVFGCPGEKVLTGNVLIMR